MNRYKVFQRRLIDGQWQAVCVGIVTAVNFSHASTKAQQIYTHQSWVERMDDNGVSNNPARRAG
jgi:hypothetical protein